MLVDVPLSGININLNVLYVINPFLRKVISQFILENTQVKDHTLAFIVKKIFHVAPISRHILGHTQERNHTNVHIVKSLSHRPLVSYIIKDYINAIL